MTSSVRKTSCGHEIIPRPLEMKALPGVFLLRKDTIIASDDLSGNTAKYLSEAVAPAAGFYLQLRTIDKAPRSNAVILRINSGQKDLGEGGYELSVRPDIIRVEACKPAGLFYACQTLRQILPGEILGAKKTVSPSWNIPCVEIRDSPRFPWRGLMLDPARYFLSVDFIMRYIDLLAFYKMNRLHLHLNDTQAWTLEIKKYPRLTDPKTHWPAGEKERGFYSQRDMRDIVAYGAARHVMVIPEFDLPSHSRAVLNAYPELICAHLPRPSGSHAYGEMCAGREDVYEFIDDVLSEIVSIFSAPYVHIGGDEYGGSDWEKCPDCQKRIRSENLEKEDTPELQRLFKNCMGSSRKYLLYRYMMRRVAKMVVAKNRIPVLWDDMAWRGRFPEKSVIMQWHYRGAFDWMQNADTPENPAREAAEAGHGAIIAPHNHHYFDYFNGGALLRRLCEFDPIPPGLPGDCLRYILGPHACSWERRQTHIDGKVFPRLLALAEEGWTAGPLRRWENFLPRLKKHLPRLEILGVRYTKPEQWPRKELSHQWEAPARADWQASWLINEIVASNGFYEARVNITRGKDKVALTGLCRSTDGHEFIPCELKKANQKNAGEFVYRLAISGYNPGSLYSVKLCLKGDGKSACRGKIVFKKL